MNKIEDVENSVKEFSEETNPEVEELRINLIKSILDKIYSGSITQYTVNGETYTRDKYEQELLKLTYDELTLYSNVKVSKIDQPFISWNMNFPIHNIEDNAKEVLKHNPMFYDSELKIWWKWDFEYLYWIEITEVQIMDFIKRTFPVAGLSVSSNRTTILNALKDESQKYKPKKPKDTWLQIGTIIYDIASNEEFEPSKEYFITTRLPYSLSECEDTPFIDKLFTDWQGINKQYLYDVVALTISPKNFLDEFFFFQGGGSDGKSVFIKILENLVGFENTKASNIEIIADPNQRFATSFLKDKYLLTLGDGNFPILKNTKFLKEACGGTDLLSAERKGSNKVIDFESRLTIIGSFNTLPQTTDLTDGFFRRMNLLFWNNKFDGSIDIYKELIDNYSYEFNNLMLKSLNRLREIYKTRKINGKLSVDETRKIYLEYSNPLKRFFKVSAEEDLKGVMTANIAYNEFKKWADKNRVNPYDFPTFKKLLGEDSYITYQRTWVYQTSDGHIYRDENEIPENKKYDSLEKTQIYVYRGYRLNSSKGLLNINPVVSEEVVSDE